MRRSIVLWLLSVSAAAAISAGVTAQVLSTRAEPRVLSGADIGFRVEGTKADVRTNPATGRREPVTRLVGRFVVRVNGEWLDVQEPGGLSHLTQ